MASIPYNEIILDHFRNPRNVGEMKDADIKTTEGSPACGDQITLYLKVDPSNHNIIDVSFQSYGCASNIATGSIITEMVKGLPLEEAKKLNWQIVNEKLGGLPPVKVHCAVLAIDALHSAIEKYEIQHGLKKETVVSTKENLKERLKRVIDPSSGRDIISSNVVKDLNLSDGILTVYLSIDERNQFAANISSEIHEKIDFLPDIKKVNIIYEDKRL